MAYAPTYINVTFRDDRNRVVTEKAMAFRAVMDILMTLPEEIRAVGAETAECPLRPSGLYVRATRTGARIENRCRDVFLRNGCR